MRIVYENEKEKRYILGKLKTGQAGFEPTKCQDQNLVPYRLATGHQQRDKKALCFYDVFEKNIILYKF